MNYVKLSRDIFHEKYKDLSTSAKWLYCVLTNLEYKYRSDKNNVFYRTNNDLVGDSGMSLASVKRAKKELLDAGLIRKLYKYILKTLKQMIEAVNT